MTYSAEPSAFGNFRVKTQTRKATMLGVMTIPRRCKCVRCNKQRTEATGRHTDEGFVCGMCGGKSE